MDNNVLAHYGVLGMKWGVRRYQNKDGSLTSAGKKHYGGNEKTKKEADPARQERLRKVAIATGTALTVAAATALYLKNKDAVDGFVKKYGDQLLSNIKNTSDSVKKEVTAMNKVREAGKKVKADASAKAMKEYAQAHKSEILKSASKLNRYKDYLSDDEVKSAIKNLQQTRDLHQLSQDNIRRGANYVSAFLAYGTVATTAYGLTKSPLAKDISKGTQKPKEKSKDKG